MARRKRSGAVEYAAPDAAPWRIELFDQFKARFGIEPGDLPAFHGAAADYSWPWAIVRAIYGIQPSVPPPDTDPESLRPLSFGEICEKLGTDRKGVEDALETMTSVWTMHRRQSPVPPQPVPEPAPLTFTPTVDAATPEPAATPDLTQDPQTEQESLAVAAHFGFPASTFDIPDRDASTRSAEIRWLAATLIALRKLFEEPTAAGLARRAIVNEIFLRRTDDEMMRVLPSNVRFQELIESKRNIEQAYGKQWEQLENLCPWIRSVTNKITFTGCLSDLIRGMQEWGTSGESMLLDGTFSNMGIQVEMRASEQNPEPRYRPGWVLACIEARQGLFDPKWKRQLPQALFRVLDDGLRESYAKLVDRGLIKLPNLESEGPESEYPPLVEPEPPAEDATLPDHIQLD